MHTAFSIGVVENKFYSVPHGGVFSAVRDKMNQSGEIGFQNSTGGNSDHFLALLKFYLRSAVLNLNDEFYGRGFLY